MNSVLQRLLDLLYPPKCTFCRRLLKENETELCDRCRQNLPESPEKTMQLDFIKNVWAVYPYEGLVRESVLRYKFSGMLQYAESYGKLLAMRLLRENPSFDCITWVPISKKRKKKRGYDQAYLLARITARELGIPCIRTLQKILENKVQSSISDASARRANVLGAYRAVSPERIKNKHILLIDDVITSGATISECAMVLLTSGARQVDCAAFAATRLSDTKKQ